MGPREDFLHNSGFGISVLLHVFPCFGREIAFRALVQKAVLFIGTKPVAECEHTLNFRASDGKAVQINVRVGTLKDAVFIPFWFADSQYIARSFECRNVGGFVCRVRDHKQNVDPWFGGKSGHCRRADMLDRKNMVTKRRRYSRSLFLE